MCYLFQMLCEENHKASKRKFHNVQNGCFSHSVRRAAPYKYDAFQKEIPELRISVNEFEEIKVSARDHLRQQSSHANFVTNFKCVLFKDRNPLRYHLIK